MQIELYSPISLWEKGKRPKNEDNIYPAIGEVAKDSPTFLVCDGVGGAAKGEVASQIVANTFGTSFKKRTATPQNLQEVLEKVQLEIDAYISSNAQHRGMGTTITFLQFNEHGAIIAHAGDSRVYHIRKNKLLFCTSDHSLINDLKKQGRHEEAKFANSNIITRAIQGASVKEITLDIHHTIDIQRDDYFFLCSDGVCGVIPDNKLIQLLAEETSDAKKIQTINQICEEFSRDNYSAYLIKIKAVKTNHISENTIPIPPNSSTSKQNTSPKIIVENTRKSGFNWLLFLTMTLLFGVVGFLLKTTYFNNTNSESSQPTLLDEEDIKLEEVLKEVIKENEALNLSDTLSTTIEFLEEKKTLNQKSVKKYKQKTKRSKTPPSKSEDRKKQNQIKSTPPLPIIIPRTVAPKKDSSEYLLKIEKDSF